MGSAAVREPEMGLDAMKINPNTNAYPVHFMVPGILSIPYRGENVELGVLAVDSGHSSFVPRQ